MACISRRYSRQLQLSAATSAQILNLIQLCRCRTCPKHAIPQQNIYMYYNSNVQSICSFSDRLKRLCNKIYNNKHVKEEAPLYANSYANLIPRNKCPSLLKDRKHAVYHTGAQRRYFSVITSPGKVGPIREVPPHIPKPKYAVGGTVPSHHIGEPIIKTPEQVARMKESCQLARKILNTTASQLKTGMTTDEIDEIVHNLCIAHGAYPSTLLYKGFPKSLCTSVNNVACHGIPDDRPLQDGDIINLDITVYYNGYHGDVNDTYPIGKVDQTYCKLIAVARHCCHSAISVCRHGVEFSSIGDVIRYIAVTSGFEVVPRFTGHGIGENFHEPPEILHFDNEEKGTMKEGMIFTIEPIITAGDYNLNILDDGWTAVTVDGSNTAQCEQTILITKDRAEILTK